MATTAPPTETAAVSTSRVAAARVRFEHAMRPWRKANPMARWLVIAGSVITLVFVFLALFPDTVAPYQEAQYRVVAGTTTEPATTDGRCGQDFECEDLPRRMSPDSGFPFGTTSARLDVFSRVVHGTQVAIAIVALSTVLAMGIGVPLGLFSGYYGGRMDRILVTVMDAIYVIPGLLLAIIVAFVLREYFNPGLASAAVAVGVVYVPQYFRVIRNHTLSVKEEPFVEAARSMGAKPRTVIFRYVFFNVVQSVPVIFTLNAADAVLTLAGLGFLGFGVPYPQAEWGLDVSRALTDVVSGFWWTAFWPGVATMLLVTGLTLVGEGLNDIINPLLRVKGYKGRVPRGMSTAPGGAGGAAATVGAAAGPGEGP